MPAPAPHCYQLILTGPEDARRVARKEQAGQVVRFRKPVTGKGRSKLYILKYRDSIIYVGYTSQSIGTRLSYGFRASGETGYHGYQWKQLDEVQLLVFVFDQDAAPKLGDRSERDFYEAVEAELVYLIREQSGRWPKWQH